MAAVSAFGLSSPGAPAAPHDAHPVTIGSFGLWSLVQLGVAQTIGLDTSQDNPTATVPFQFTPNARQGPSGWYLGHLHATVELGPQPAGSASYLDASVNHWEWAQIVLKVVREAEARYYASETTKTYLPIDGLAAYNKEVQKLLFGADSQVIAEGRAVTVQGLGGTGSLKIGADFLKRFLLYTIKQIHTNDYYYLMC